MELQKTKISFLLISLTVIIAFAPLANINCAKAGELEGIKPDAGFDYVFLLHGESATFHTSTTTPFDIHTVYFLSIGNTRMSAKVTEITDTASGIWWVMLMGTASRSWYDFSYGFYSGVAPHSGAGTQINVNQTFSFGLAIGGLILYPATVSAESPVEYSMQIN